MMPVKFVVLLVVCFTVMNLLVALGIYRIRRKIEQVLDETSLIRRALVPPNVGGRAVPSLADIAAAKNRIDSMGTAHPGAPG